MREPASRCEDVSTLADRLLRVDRRSEQRRHRERSEREAERDGSSHVSALCDAIIGMSQTTRAAQPSCRAKSWLAIACLAVLAYNAR